MSQGVVLRGSSGNSDIFAQVDPSHDAVRVSLRPYEHLSSESGVIGGHYSINVQTGLMAAGIASAAQVFQVRWADPAKLFILKKLKVQCGTCTAFAATSLGAPLQLWAGHNSTANGSGGGAASFTSGNKMRASMATSAFASSGEVRIATTAALTAATGQTLEANALGGCMGATQLTNTQSPEMYLFDQRDAGGHPLVLLTGDTLAVLTKDPAATGTWTANVTMEWLEVVAF